MYQALVLAATYSLLLTAVGWTWDTWQFWCFLALFWCIDRIARMAGRVEGIIDYIDMPEAEQLRLKRLLMSARKETNG